VFLSVPADALPSNRPAGAAGTLILHAAAISFLLLAVTTSRLSNRSAGSEPRLVIVEMSAALEPAPAPPLPGGYLSGPALEVSASQAQPGSTSLPPGTDPFPFDTARIAAHRDALFPFLTARLSFLDELHEAREADARRLHNPFSSGTRQSEHPPLVLTPAALDALVDATWSRRQRWQNFKRIADLTAAHDPDMGQLPALVRAYVDGNLLQPYFESGSADPRFWVMLGLAADHVDVLEFAGRFVRKHPSSRTTTELLFLLDELTQASRDALAVLLSTEPTTELLRTRAASPRNFDLAVSLGTAYRAWLREHELDDPGTLAAHFDEVRLSILTAIVEMSPDGYGAADARFLAGRMSWDRNDVSGAVRWWREMKTDERNSYAAVRAEIGRALGPGTQVNVVEIVRALGAERGRWLRNSEARLRRFGYTFETF